MQLRVLVEDAMHGPRPFLVPLVLASRVETRWAVCRGLAWSSWIPSTGVEAWLLPAEKLNVIVLSLQAPRVCRAEADPGGPPPALRAGLQPPSACVEVRLRAAGVVCWPGAQVCGGDPELMGTSSRLEQRP